jgi:hypothetical protein
MQQLIVKTVQKSVKKKKLTMKTKSKFISENPISEKEELDEEPKEMKI